MTQDAYPTIAELIRREEAIGSRIDSTIRRTYPIGSKVIYSTFSYTIEAEVTMHGHGGKVRIRNLETGRERWVEGRSRDLAVPEKKVAGNFTRGGLQIDPIEQQIQEAFDGE